jgi:hypothetical protein
MRHLKDQFKFECISSQWEYNKTYYRPKEIFWSIFLSDSIQTESAYEDLKIGKWLEAREAVEDEFRKLEKWYYQNYDLILKAHNSKGGTGLSPERLKQQNKLIDIFIEKVKISLAMDFLSSGSEIEDIYSLLIKNVSATLTAYSALWRFNAQTYAAPGIFKQQMELIEKLLEAHRENQPNEDSDHYSE